MPATTDTDAIVINPVNGEVLQVSSAPSDLLAQVILVLHEREKRFKEWRGAAEAELVARLEKEGRTAAIVGDYEVSFKAPRGRVWDPDELETVLRELVDAGTLHAGELTGLLTHETKVNGTKAKDLLGLLHGRAKALVEGCFRWETKGRPRLEVTESIQLNGPQEELR